MGLWGWGNNERDPNFIHFCSPDQRQDGGLPSSVGQTGIAAVETECDSGESGLFLLPHPEPRHTLPLLQLLPQVPRQHSQTGVEATQGHGGRGPMGGARGGRGRTVLGESLRNVAVFLKKKLQFFWLK